MTVFFIGSFAGLVVGFALAALFTNFFMQASLVSHHRGGFRGRHSCCLEVPCSARCAERRQGLYFSALVDGSHNAGQVTELI